MKHIGLLDCNNFFVSCERLFRPDLMKKPVAVLSSNDGCIVSRSQEVKDLGVPMGMPYFQIKDVCAKEGITVFSSNFKLYRDISARVMRALKEEFGVCEIYSIDEAFFEVDTTTTESDLLEARAGIIQKTGIPVSIGIAKTKTLAKLGSKEAKKGGGVCMLSDDMWQNISKTLPCGTVWGIGRQMSASLTKLGVGTVEEFLALDRAYVARQFGVVGERLQLELSGTPVYRVDERATHERESYTSTRSFGNVIHDKATLMSAIGHHTAHVAEKLRADGQLASRITLVLRGSRFGAFSHRESGVTCDVAFPTNDTLTLTKEASKLLDTFYDSEIPYNKAGVVVSGIVPEGSVSLSLFDTHAPLVKRKNLNVLTDVLNEKFGHGTVRAGVVSGVSTWAESKKRISKEYTTKWSEIPRVKAV